MSLIQQQAAGAMQRAAASYRQGWCLSCKRPLPDYPDPNTDGDGMPYTLPIGWIHIELTNLQVLPPWIYVCPTCAAKL